MRRSAVALLSAVAATIFLSGNPMTAGSASSGPAVPAAGDAWKAEFEAVCSRTDVAMTLSVSELKDLVARCVKLAPEIEAQEESTRKVYLRRLRMCRDLYKYVLETKERSR
jgi:hypothetical protein